MSSSSLQSQEPLVPPINIAMVCAGVYRSGYPTKKNYPFLRVLRLRSVLYLCPEDYAESNLKFCEENNINVLRFPTEGNKEPFNDISEPLMHRILSAICDTRNLPLLIHCNKGKHRTGTVVGCVRLVQGWSLVSIFEEYRRFAGDKARVGDQQYIELYKPIVVVKPPYVASWLYASAAVTVVRSEQQLIAAEADQLGWSLLAPEAVVADDMGKKKNKNKGGVEEAGGGGGRSAGTTAPPAAMSTNLTSSTATAASLVVSPTGGVARTPSHSVTPSSTQPTLAHSMKGEENTSGGGGGGAAAASSKGSSPASRLGHPLYAAFSSSPVLLSPRLSPSHKPLHASLPPPSAEAPPVSSSGILPATKPTSSGDSSRESPAVRGASDAASAPCRTSTSATAVAVGAALSPSPIVGSSVSPPPPPLTVSSQPASGKNSSPDTPRAPPPPPPQKKKSSGKGANSSSHS